MSRLSNFDHFKKSNTFMRPLPSVFTRRAHISSLQRAISHRSINAGDAYDEKGEEPSLEDGDDNAPPGTTSMRIADSTLLDIVRQTSQDATGQKKGGTR